MCFYSIFTSVCAQGTYILLSSKAPGITDNRRTTVPPVATAMSSAHSRSIFRRIDTQTQRQPKYLGSERGAKKPLLRRACTVSLLSASCLALKFGSIIPLRSEVQSRSRAKDGSVDSVQNKKEGQRHLDEPTVACKVRERQKN